MVIGLFLGIGDILSRRARNSLLLAHKFPLYTDYHFYGSQ